MCAGVGVGVGASVNVGVCVVWCGCVWCGCMCMCVCMRATRYNYDYLVGVVDDVEYDLPPAPVERPNLVGSHKVKLFHRVLVQDGVGRMKHAELLTYHLQVLTFRVWSVFGESTHRHTLGRKREYIRE